jgi:hypothetical protein
MASGITIHHDTDLEALEVTWDARHAQDVYTAASLVARTVRDMIEHQGYLGPQRIRVQRVTQSDVDAGRAPRLAQGAGGHG